MFKEKIAEAEEHLKDSYRQLEEMADIIKKTEMLIAYAENAITDEFQKMVLEGQRKQLDKCKQDYDQMLKMTNEMAISLTFEKAIHGML